MKVVSIETQKKIMLIPVVNVFLLWIYGSNCRILHIPAKVRFKGDMYLLGYTLPPGVLYLLMLDFFPDQTEILTMIAIYIVPLIMSLGLIKFQSKYLFGE